MSFVPEEELRSKGAQSLAPMIDFLFLMLMFFASLAISRATARDTDIDLVKIQPDTKGMHADTQLEHKIVNLSITKDGKYKWVTELHDYPMKTAADIGDELVRQYDRGLLPEDKTRTQVLLKIDKEATWDPILKAIFAIREAGFQVHPVYEPDDSEAA